MNKLIRRSILTLLTYGLVKSTVALLSYIVIPAIMITIGLNYIAYGNSNWLFILGILLFFGAFLSPLIYDYLYKDE